MNKCTYDIMRLLNVDAEMALKIQDLMEIDFSECTQREFNKEVRFAYANINRL